MLWRGYHHARYREAIETLVLSELCIIVGEKACPHLSAKIDMPEASVKPFLHIVSE